MYFRLITCQGDGALGYLLGDVAAGEAVAIDPAPGETDSLAVPEMT